jgi:predicted secreted hydrolase
MKKYLTLLSIAAAAILAAVLVFQRFEGEKLPSARLDIPAVDLEGFAVAQAPADIRIPEDFGPHPDFLTEWWYYTGNLDAPDGRHFGYQLTFFRRALVPPENRSEGRQSDWATEQLYLAHFTVTDVSAGTFVFNERYNRGAAGLAGANGSPYRVWLEDWFVESSGPGRYRLSAELEGFRLELELEDQKGPILQGQDGYSQKGPQPGNASYYISQTRLAASGTLTKDGQTIPVEGLSWMDHEYSTSALGPDQVGWDWFSIQLDNETELMLFHLRKENGEVDRFSSGAIIYPDGSTRSLARDDYEIIVQDTWVSPQSGAEYPSRWQINVPSEGIELALEPFLPEQELLVFFTYWEGAVRISGSDDGAAVSGSGYVEMTGYAHSMQGEF